MLKRKIIISIFSFVLVLLCAIWCGHIPDNISVKSSYNPTKIIIDAGHGGFDGGAVANDGTIEKDINLNISLALEKLLSSAGYEVIMTRQNDASTEDNSEERIAKRKKSDLENRLKVINSNKDALFVSIHLNKFTTSAARGSQIFYGGKNDDSKKLADSIQGSFVNLIQPENKRVSKKANSSTYLLYHSPIPSVIVECGFLSNKAELENLKNTDYQNKLAFAIFCGITDFFSNIEEV